MVLPLHHPSLICILYIWIFNLLVQLIVEKIHMRFFPRPEMSTGAAVDKKCQTFGHLDADQHKTRRE